MDRFVQNKVFENGDFLIVNKPSGMVVNRSGTVKEETLQDLISTYLKLPEGDLGIGDRAGIVHRIDRETSGLVVIAKSEKAFLALQEEFKNRKVQKEYIALVHGKTEKVGHLESRIGRIGKFGKFGEMKRRDEDGRESVSDFLLKNYYEMDSEVINVLRANIKSDEKFPNITKPRINYLRKNALLYTLLSVFPKTGRTHQIRVQLKSIGHPVVSDSIYTQRKLFSFDILWCLRLFLHASKLSFVLWGKPFVFEATLPYDLVEVLRSLKKLPDGNF